MNSAESKKNDAAQPLLSPGEQTVTIQTPPTVVSDGQGLKIKHQELEEALANARKKLTDEDFVQALSIVDSLLLSDPQMEPARVLREQILLAAGNLSREIFDQGLNSYMECDWDRATTLWKKTLQIVPDDTAAQDWIAKAERKKEQEKSIRVELLQELEECGKMLSERNYVVAEEHLESLKNKFTGGFRLTDLQRIYEALVVRTRIELEKEFEDLRSNVVESPAPVVFEKRQLSTETKARAKEALLRKEYMESFEAGKKFFESGEWQEALAMWQTARRINPQDVNLTHWIALAENNLVRGEPILKSSPVRSTIVFLSVFFVTALLTYVAYQKYAEYTKETKNRSLIQRAIDHYRAGRLEESWKTLQVYILQDPGDESARTLLERITSEMNARERAQNRFKELDQHLQNGRKEKEARNYPAAIQYYEKVLEIDPTHSEARDALDQMKKVVDMNQLDQNVSALVREGEVLLTQNQLDSAAEKLKQALVLRPGEPTAEALLSRIESKRNHLNRVAVQLEVARYLIERNQKESAVLVLNRILSVEPDQPQAKQLLARTRGSSAAPRIALEIRILPAARLWIDGRDCGINSYFNQMETAGSHIIHIEQQGYHSLDQAIEVKSSDKNQFQFQLKRM